MERWIESFTEELKKQLENMTERDAYCCMQNIEREFWRYIRDIYDEDYTLPYIGE